MAVREIHVDPSIAYAGGKAQIAGLTSANLAEVESGTKALRTVAYYDDYDFLGAYATNHTGSFNLTTAALTNAIVCSFRWPDTGTVALIKKFRVSWVLEVQVSTSANLGVHKLVLYKTLITGDPASAYQATPLLNAGNLRSRMPEPSAFGFTYLSTILSNAARTLEAQPLAALIGSVWGVQFNQDVFMTDPMLDYPPGEHGLMLSANTGIELQATAPAASTSQNIRFAIEMVWHELAQRGY